MAKSSSTSSTDALSARTRLAIVHGPERFLQDLHINRLRDELIEAQGGGDDAVQTVRFDGGPGGGGAAGPVSVADILDECRSMGLMTAFKLVIVDNADLLLKAADGEEGPDTPASPTTPVRRGQKSNRELMEAYAAEPSDSATLILRADTWRPGKLDKAVEKLGPAGAIVKCEPPSADKAMKWARDRCQNRYNATLTPEAASLLVENLGPELGRIDAELGKLALAEPGKPISVELVRQFVGMSREEEFWKIEQSLLSGDPAVALSHLREMIDVSRHDPVPLNWAFINLAKKLHGLSRGMAQGDNPRSLMGALKIWGRPDEVEQLLRSARKLKPNQAAALLQAAIDNDVKLKTSQGDPVTNLEALALRFTSEIS